MEDFSVFCVQEEENRRREELRQEWKQKQEKIKSECQTHGSCKLGDVKVTRVQLKPVG